MKTNFLMINALDKLIALTIFEMDTLVSKPKLYIPCTLNIDMDLFFHFSSLYPAPYIELYVC